MYDVSNKISETLVLLIAVNKSGRHGYDAIYSTE